jgi:hypothetical protein
MDARGWGGDGMTAYVDGAWNALELDRGGDCTTLTVLKGVKFMVSNFVCILKRIGRKLIGKNKV